MHRAGSQSKRDTAYVDSNFAAVVKIQFLLAAWDSTRSRFSPYNA